MKTSISIICSDFCRLCSQYVSTQALQVSTLIKDHAVAFAVDTFQTLRLLDFKTKTRAQRANRRTVPVFYNMLLYRCLYYKPLDQPVVFNCVNL